MDLKDFIGQFSSSGDLRRIRAEVDPNLEMAALCRQEFARRDGSALFFERIAGYRFRGAANLFGSAARMSAILRSADMTQFGARLGNALKQQTGDAGNRLLSLGSEGAGLQSLPPGWKQRSGATLFALPALISWQQERKPYMTLPLVVTKHPLSGKQNLGIYRTQRLNDHQLAINISTGSGAGEHLKVAADQGKPLPVALVFGGDLALYFLAAAPLPRECDEFGLFHTLFGEKLVSAQGCTQELLLPADAEFVVEGFIPPGQTCTEGPFGNHTGSYVSRRDCPVMECTSISWREEAIMPFTVVGPPPSEILYLGRANEILIREMLRIDYPEIIQLRMPEATLFHGVALLQLAADCRLNVLELITRLWHDSPLRKSKLLVVFDADLDLARTEQIYWRLINQLEPARIHQKGGQLALDATGVDPRLLVVEDKATADLIRRRSAEYNG